MCAFYLFFSFYSSVIPCLVCDCCCSLFSCISIPLALFITIFCRSMMGCVIAAAYVFIISMLRISSAIFITVRMHGTINMKLFRNGWEMFSQKRAHTHKNSSICLLAQEVYWFADAAWRLETHTPFKANNFNRMKKKHRIHQSSLHEL